MLKKNKFTKFPIVQKKSITLLFIVILTFPRKFRLRSDNTLEINLSHIFNNKSNNGTILVRNNIDNNGSNSTHKIHIEMFREI